MLVFCLEVNCEGQTARKTGVCLLPPTLSVFGSLVEKDMCAGAKVKKEQRLGWSCGTWPGYHLLVIRCTQLQAHMSEQPLLIQVTDLRSRHSWLGSGEKSCVCTERSIRGRNSPSTSQKSSKAGLVSSRCLCYRCGIS